MAPLWALLAVFVAGTVKGTAGLGFPTLATPLLSLTVDVKTAVVLLILPNIVMDGIQFSRRGAPIGLPSQRDYPVRRRHKPAVLARITSHGVLRALLIAMRSLRRRYGCAFAASLAHDRQHLIRGFFRGHF